MKKKKVFPTKVKKQDKLIIFNHIFGIEGMSRQMQREVSDEYISKLKRNGMEIEGYKIENFFTFNNEFCGTKIEVLYTDILSTLKDVADENGMIDYNALKRVLKIRDIIKG